MLGNTSPILPKLMTLETRQKGPVDRLHTALYVWPVATGIKLSTKVSNRKLCRKLDTGRREISTGRPQKTRRMTFAEDLQGMGVTRRGTKESPAIHRYGGISSSDVLRRTAGPKSK